MPTPKTTLKTNFSARKKPTEAHFHQWLDSYIHKSEDGLFLDDSGNLGIGTATPNGRLHIMGNPTEDANGYVLTIGPDFYEDAPAQLRLGFTNKYSWIQSHNQHPLHINDLGNDVIMNSTTGNVGIGTSLPVAKLHVKGTLRLEEASSDRFWEIVPISPEDYGPYNLEFRLDFKYGGRTIFSLRSNGSARKIDIDDGQIFDGRWTQLVGDY